MDKIIRCITSDGAVMASAINSTDIVYTAQAVHKTSTVATAALGRMLTATSMMGAMLKKSDATINLRMSGNGPLGAIVTVGDANGNVKGYVGNANCPTAYYDNGKINVSQAVGKDGILNVMRDLGSGDPFVTQVPITSGEIAEDITNYYATSEQIPTVCALGVLIDKETSLAILSGGFLIQLLPGADESTITRLEENISKLESVTTMLAKGFSILDICKKALDGFEVEVLDEYPVHYVCSCNKEKLQRILEGFSKEELEQMVNEEKPVNANCNFCNKTYTFTADELKKILKNKEKADC